MPGDGVDICGSGTGEEPGRRGERRDLLLPGPVAAGVPHPGTAGVHGPKTGPTGTGPGPGRGRDRHTLAFTETRFGLGLPRGVLEDGPLPA
ncbi:hypothetical protein Snoj_26680 [Streptomyces nojiriensis]|uniref:Uncharacterized protein n=1 Tax=Streptomyces nojiriensis TaxID=66374 RepID=A0ABQ3SKU2_9ACTN|nr:hypothetical protein [Streptomyces nojiriensis]QTI50330.1 hypothetical protein JYK04_08207 [Streptomyces nojiriensis]GGS41196.1 hypothetical protein GCM10010205_82600 [Streptomyces nojiriensis]GHI68750.1 hypothetical protein Snoj_26680 [Streptomyces nojiriensis]